MKLVPTVEQAELLRQEFQDQYKIWRDAHEAKQPKFVVENVRFRHDPQWRNRLMSIQAIRDQRHVVWRVVKTLWVISMWI